MYHDFLKSSLNVKYLGCSQFCTLINTAVKNYFRVNIQSHLANKNFIIFQIFIFDKAHIFENE